MKTRITLAFIFIIINSVYGQERGISLINSTEATTGNTYAIVIGISKYKNIPQLQFADKDAKSFYDYMVAKDGMNVKPSNVVLRINEQANITNVGNDVSDILQKDIKKGDRVIFFFAGHGDYDAKIMKDQSLLLLQGAPNGNYFQNVFSGDYISTSDLHIKFTSELIKKGADVILIIDACHSGGMSSPLAGGEQGGIITASAINTIQSTVKLYSCQAKQYSLESTQFGGGRGLFSYVLMEGLYGMADANNDSVVNIKELQRYLEDNVPSMASPNRQDPVVKAEDNMLAVSHVNKDFLASYKKTKDKNLQFLAAVNIKGSEDNWLKAMTDDRINLYKTCKQQTEDKKLNEAYITFKKYELLDKTSDASIFLRRNLSAALQERTAIILTPMLEDISKFDSSTRKVAEASDDLEKAAELLGKAHFLYDKLQARKLFLKTLVLIWRKDKTKIKECTENLEQSILFEPNAPYTYFLLSNLYQEANNTAKAETNIKKYLDLIPSSSWAHNNYGNLLKNLKRYEEAETEYKKAIELSPDNTNPNNNYGNLLKDLKRYEESETQYKKAIALNPNNANPHYNYGNLLQYLKRYEEAETEYKKTIELNQSYINAHYNYGNLLKKIKRYDEVETEYKKAIALNPNDANGYRLIANLYYTTLKQYDSSAVFYQKVITLDKKDMNSIERYAYSLLRLNKINESIKAFENEIQQFPDYEWGYYNLACVHSLQNDTDKAMLYFTKALQKGMIQLEHWQTDNDIDNIRSLPAFKAVLLKYFKLEDLDKFPNLFIVQKK